MPTFAPEIKVANVRRLGANVILFGNDFDDAKRECMRLAEEKKFVFIPPFDDPYVIAGQGTVGVEILRQLKEERCDAIFIAVGGGGLLAGVSAYVVLFPRCVVRSSLTNPPDSLNDSVRKLR